MAEEKKNRSEELESLDKKINEIINGWNQNPEEIVEFLQFSSKFSYAYPMRRKTPCFSYGDIRRVHRIYASN